MRVNIRYTDKLHQRYIIQMMYETDYSVTGISRAVKQPSVFVGVGLRLARPVPL